MGLYLALTERRRLSQCGPEVSFHTVFPNSGLYKAWGQFKHRGKIIMVAFVLEVN